MVSFRLEGRKVTRQVQNGKADTISPLRAMGKGWAGGRKKLRACRRKNREKNIVINTKKVCAAWNCREGYKNLLRIRRLQRTTVVKMSGLMMIEIFSPQTWGGWVVSRKRKGLEYLQR